MKEKMSIVCGYVLYNADRNEQARFRRKYRQWERGWIHGGGWYGHQTLQDAFERAQTSQKPDGCSWYAFGYLMAKGAYQTAKEMANR